MKALNSRQLSSLISIAFKTAGIIMILAAIVDMAILPIPFQLQNREWLLGFITQVVDRGIIPMLGIALIIAGNWVDSLANNAAQPGPSWRSLQFWALVLASVLAALYMLLTVVHVSNVLALQNQRLNEIAEQAAQAEQQLDERINAEIGQRREQIAQLLENDELREQAIAQGLISPEDIEQLRDFQDNPEQLDVFLQGLEEQASGLRTEQQTEIGVRREEAQEEARTNAFKALARIGLSSIMLAIGYGIIGWSGLRLHLKGSV